MMVFFSSAERTLASASECSVRPRPGSVAQILVSKFAVLSAPYRLLGMTTSFVRSSRRALALAALSASVIAFPQVALAQSDEFSATASADQVAALDSVVIGDPYDARDPFESINRGVFAFNNGLDRFALRPLAKTYDVIVPNPAKQGVNNFFGNLYDVTSAFNSMLQWHWNGAFRNTGRVLINSTLGIGGIFDVATPLGVERRRTDFGQTLATWGLPEGPYLMLPLFGPSTIRSGAGTLVDTFAFSVTPYVEDETIRYALWATEFVHLRSMLLETDQLLSGDRYIFVRDAYLQSRDAFVNDGKIVDDFSEFEDDWDSESEF